MSEIHLSGLKAGDPIGFLAGLGLLRVCSHRTALGTVKLGWQEPARAAGVLVTHAECDPDRLIEEVLNYMRGRHQLPVLSGRPAPGVTIGDDAWDDVKVAPDLFADLLRATRPQVNLRDRESADFLAALGSECIRAQHKNEVKPSALHMTSGNQQFLETLRDLAKSLEVTEPPAAEPKPKKKANRDLAKSLDVTEPAHPKASCPPADAFREALFGEWRSADAFSSLGFDPSTEAIYALTAAAPTDTGPRSTRAAVWLAVEAIPLFPCFPVGGRLHTRGFIESGTKFRWPVWTTPLTLPEIRTLVGLPAVFALDPSPTTLRSYGVCAVFEAERVTIGKGYGQFRPGIRIC